MFIRLLALLVLTTSLLLPRGFMPARDPDGLIRITLCTGYGPVEAMLQLPMSQDAPEQDKHPSADHKATCPYASYAGPLTEPAGGDTVIASRFALDLVTPALPEQGMTPGRGMAAPPPPSHAPPAQLS